VNNGWIKLHRALLGKSIWKCSTPEQKIILITLLLMANHEDNEWDWGGKRFLVKKGEFVTSLESIRKSTGKDIGIRQIRTALDRFTNLGFLTCKSTKSGRVITILNYDKYQSSSNGKRQSNRQTVDKQLTTNKNDKNVKKRDTKVSLCQIPENFTVTEEMKSWFFEQGFMNIEIKSATDEFVDYWLGVGGKKKDWVATWRNGMRKKNEWSSDKKTSEDSWKTNFLK